MKLIESHKRLISWYQNKLGLSEYGMLWLVFFERSFCCSGICKTNFTLDV